LKRLGHGELAFPTLPWKHLLVKKRLFRNYRGFGAEATDFYRTRARKEAMEQWGIEYENDYCVAEDEKSKQRATK
jgi:hypothetical protein